MLAEPCEQYSRQMMTSEEPSTTEVGPKLRFALFLSHCQQVVVSLQIPSYWTSLTKRFTAAQSIDRLQAALVVLRSSLS